MVVLGAGLRGLIVGAGIGFEATGFRGVAGRDGAGWLVKTCDEAEDGSDLASEAWCSAIGDSTSTSSATLMTFLLLLAPPAVPRPKSFIQNVWFLENFDAYKTVELLVLFSSWSAFCGALPRWWLKRHFIYRLDQAVQKIQDEAEKKQ